MNVLKVKTVLASLLALFILVGCQKQTETSSLSSKENKTPDSTAKSTTSIDFPKDWPSDLNLPTSVRITNVSSPLLRRSSKDNNLQNETSNANIERENKTFDVKATGVYAGKINNAVDEIHQLFLKNGWKADIVIPQGDTAIMQYASNNQQTVMELKKTSPEEVAVKLHYDRK